MSRLPALLIPLFMLAGCSSTAFVQQDLQHHHWVLSKLDGQPVASVRDNPPDLEIGEHFTVNGIAGCNRYFGQGHLKKDKLWVTSLGSTVRACTPPLDAIETGGAHHPDRGGASERRQPDPDPAGQAAPFGIPIARLGVLTLKSHITNRNMLPGCGTI